jgi:hypothetical protein
MSQRHLRSEHVRPEGEIVRRCRCGHDRRAHAAGGCLYLHPARVKKGRGRPCGCERYDEAWSGWVDYTEEAA